MNETTVNQATRIIGTLTVPGDKSIAHRSLILGAVARGTQVITGLPGSADVKTTAACLQALGCEVTTAPDGTTRVGDWTGEVAAVIDAGNSGTSARLLAGLIAGRGGECAIDGDESLRRRPMTRIAEPLRLMGAEVETSAGGRLPLTIRGGELTGIRYRPAVASAQVKSAVLIAGLFARGSTTVEEIAPTRDHTENMLAAMGVTVARDGLKITVPGETVPEAVPVTVPGDASSAAFHVVAATLLPGSELRLPGCGVNPTRSGALRVLARMGADITLENPRTCAGEDIADILVRGSSLQGVEIGGDTIPTLIDELPVLAVAASQAAGTTTVRDAAELRHKEADRIAGTVQNLQRLGADITEREDGFVVEGPCRLRGAAVEAFGDHRLAMAMAVAGLLAAGSTRIAGSSTVGISYPGFFADLRAVAR